MNRSLEARDLTCGYGNRQVLDSLSLAARAGEVLVLLGANGAGKTTLLRALARQLRPARGCVLLKEQDIQRLSPPELARRVSLTPQSERRDWPLTIEQAVLLGRAPHRGWLLPYTPADRERVELALNSTGLSDMRERLITELSGGEWRRTILARALAQEAEVLLLDEPTAGLDLKYQVDVLRLVRRLAIEQQLVVVLTLHDLNQASLYGDRIALLARHRLIALGTAEEVFTAELIQQTYGVPVTIVRHPVYSTPLVVPLDADANAAPPKP